MSRKTKTTATKEEARPALVPKLRFPEFRDEPAWEGTTIGALGRFYYGKSAPKWSLSDDAPTPCVRYGELYTKFGPVISETYSRTNTDPKTLRFSKGGEILIPRVGEKPDDFGKCCAYLPLKDIAIGEMISVLETKQHPLFYTYYFRTLYKQFAKVVEGQNVKNLYFAELEPLQIQRPSIPEQQKIAECLSSVDELMAAQARKLDALKTHKKGLMQQLFPREGETQPRLRFPEFQNAGEWERVRLDEISRVIRGSSPRPQGDPRFFGGPVPRLMVQDVTRDGKWVTPRIDSLTEEGATMSRPCPAGTLTIVCSGVVGIVSFLAVDACIHDGFLALVEIDESRADKDFLFHTLSTLRNEFERGATHGGVFTNLTTQGIKEFAINCPGIPEQQRIASCLTSLDDLIAAQTQKHEALKTHKKGLMQQLFPSPESIDS